MESKSFAGEFKTAAEGDAPGTFEAVVSVFGNVDSVGDRMVKGAFARTLEEKGLPPVCWSHEWSTPPIGSVSEAKETDEGLLIKGRLFVAKDEDHAVARQVYAAMKAGALKEFSFGYATKGSHDVEEDGETIREITDVDLFEVGPTLVGANSETRLVGVKTLESAVAASIAIDGKAGRVLSKSNETKLRDAAALIADVVAAVDEEPKNLSGDAAETKDDSPQDTGVVTPDEPVSQGLDPKIAAVLLATPYDRTHLSGASEGEPNE